MNIIEELGIPVSRNWTTHKQILPLSIETFEISPNLLNAPKTLWYLAIQYQNKRKIISVTSDPGPCPSSLTELEYKPWFFDEPECLSSNKENILPIESITPPSLKNLSLEEGTTGNETEATSWEASVAKNIMTTSRAGSPYPGWPGTLEQLEPDTDNEIIDITDYAERPSNDKRSPQHVQKYITHNMTKGHCPTPQTSPTYITMNVKAAPAKPHQVEIQGILLDKRRTPHGWPTCLKKQPPRVAFKNNDIYMVNGEESNPYEEPQEWNVKVFYKLKVNKDPTYKTCPMKRTLMMITMSP